jgi:hypothetical protein
MVIISLSVGLADAKWCSFLSEGSILLVLLCIILNVGEWKCRRMERMSTAGKKQRCTFTLSNESVKFLTEVGRETHAASKSSVLDEILLEKRRERELARSEAAIAAYYDGLTNDQIAENEAWAKIAESQFPLE